MGRCVLAPIVRCELDAFLASRIRLANVRSESTSLTLRRLTQLGADQIERVPEIATPRTLHALDEQPVELSSANRRTCLSAKSAPRLIPHRLFLLSRPIA